ncbi:hypothetical protein MTO96_035393 [Rhipicephalus appendiculatus]
MILRILAVTTKTLPMVALEPESQPRVNHGRMRNPGVIGSRSVHSEQQEYTSRFGTRCITTLRYLLDRSVSAGGLAVLRTRWSFQSHPYCLCQRGSSTAVTATSALQSQEFASSQPECLGTPALLQAESVAATSEQPPVTQPTTSVVFVMELATPLLDHHAPDHLGPRPSRRSHLGMTARTQPEATCLS